MAREVRVNIIVDDDGTMRLTEKSAERVSKSLKKAGMSAQTADRRIKGAADASSNLTKNFAKTAQGAGGFVQAYATVAATAFAVSAAFQFLKTAGDFRVIQEGQTAYASSTGVALNLLTVKIRDAADGLLDFKAASEAAAIGSASGLSGQQLTKLAAGAADVSKILGRDVTDSFNRLVRGVTKAEPELLDELGITLRLEEATTAYASSIGKLRTELTINQRKQAVAADVLGQLEEKYARITKVLKPTNNAFVELEIAFSDVLKTFKEVAARFGEPIAKILTRNVYALIAALGLIAVPIIKNILPGLDTWVDRTQEAAARAALAVEKAQARIAKAQKKVQEFTPTTIESRARETVAPLRARRGSGLERLQQGLNLNQRQIAGMINAAKKGTGEYKKLSDDVRKKFVGDLEIMKAKALTSTQQMVLHFKNFSTKAGNYVGLVTTRVEYLASKAKSVGASFFSLGAKGIDKLIRLGGYVAIATLAFEGLKSALQKAGLIELNEELIKQRKELDKQVRSVEGTIEAYSQFAEVQAELIKVVDKDGNQIGIEIKSTNISAGAKALGGVTEVLTDLRRTAKAANFELKDLTSYDNFKLQLNEKIPESYGILARTASLAAKGLGRVGFFLKESLGYDVVDLKISDEGIESLKRAGQLSKIITDTIRELKLESTEPAKELKVIASVLEEVGQAGGQGLEAAKAALQRLEDEIDPKVIDELLGQLDALDKKESDITETVRESEKAYDKRLAALTQFSTSLDEEIRTQKQLQQSLATSTATNAQEEIERSQRRLQILEQIARAERQLALDKKKLQADETGQLAVSANLDKARIQSSFKIKNLQAEIQNIFDNQTAALNAGKIISEDKKKLDAESLRLLNNKIALEKSISEENERQLSLKLRELALDKSILVLKQQNVALNSEQFNGSLQELALAGKIAEKRKELLNAGKKKNNQEEVSRLTSEIGQLTEQQNLLKAQRRERLFQVRLANELSVIERRYGVALAYATGFTRERVQNSLTIAKNQKTIADIERQIGETGKTAAIIGAEDLEQAREKVKSLKQQNALLIEQESLQFKIRDAAINTAEKGIASTLSAILKGEEKNIGDAMLMLAKSIVDSVIDVFTQDLAVAILTKLNVYKGPGEPIKTAIKEGVDENAPTLKQSIIDGVTESVNLFSSAIESSGRAFASTVASELSILVTNLQNWIVSFQQACRECATSISEAIKEACKSCKCSESASRSDSASTAVQVFTTVASAAAGGGSGSGTGFSDAGGISNDPPLSAASGQQPLETPVTVTNAKEISEGISTKADARRVAFPSSSVDNDDKPVEEAIKKGGKDFKEGFALVGENLVSEFDGVFKKGSLDFGGVFKDILGNLGGGGGGAGGLLSSVMSIFGFAKGGMMEGGFAAYSAGGVVKKPTLGLIGEGRMNEAVVPLPDGKSIPIEGNMGGNSQVNNVNVSVSVNNEGKANTTVEQDSQAGANLGRIIAAAVQDELQNQKRPGGILSPYGAS